MGWHKDGTDGTEWRVQKEFHNSLKAETVQKAQQLMNASIKSDMSIPRNIIQLMK